MNPESRALALLDVVVEELSSAIERVKEAGPDWRPLAAQLCISLIALKALPAAADARTLLAGAEPPPRPPKRIAAIAVLQGRPRLLAAQAEGKP